MFVCSIYRTLLDCWCELEAKIDGGGQLLVTRVVRIIRWQSSSLFSLSSQDHYVSPSHWLRYDKCAFGWDGSLTPNGLSQSLSFIHGPQTVSFHTWYESSMVLINHTEQIIVPYSWLQTKATITNWYKNQRFNLG